LQIIPTAISVTVIIEGRRISSAALERNSEVTVIVNGVAENGPGGVVASEAKDANAVQGIERNNVAFPCIHAADHPVTR
jgi:hypothetical protein